MRTKTSMQSLDTSFLSCWSNKWQYFPYKPCLICILTSISTLATLLLLKREVESDSLVALTPLWDSSHLSATHHTGEDLVIETPAAAWAGRQQIPAATNACVRRECQSFLLKQAVWRTSMYKTTSHAQLKFNESCTSSISRVMTLLKHVRIWKQH